MTDLVDIELIRSTISPDTTPAQEPLASIHSKQNRLTEAVEATAWRFFKSIDNEYFVDKKLFIGYFHLANDLHRETRDSLLEAARWLCGHPDSNCIYFDEPRQLITKQIECSDGSEGRYVQSSVVLSSLVDGNMLVEDAVIQDGIVESYSYTVMGPVHLAKLVEFELSGAFCG